MYVYIYIYLSLSLSLSFALMLTAPNLKWGWLTPTDMPQIGDANGDKTLFLLWSLGCDTSVTSLVMLRFILAPFVSLVL